MRKLVFFVALMIALSAGTAFAGATFWNLGPGTTTGMISAGGIVAYNSGTSATLWNQGTSTNLGLGTTAGVAMQGSNIVVAGKVGGAASRWDSTTGSWTTLPLGDTGGWTPTSIGANSTAVYIGGYYGTGPGACRYNSALASTASISLPTNGTNASYIWGVASAMDRPVGSAMYTNNAYNAVGGLPLDWYNNFNGPAGITQTARVAAISADGTRLVGRSGGSPTTWGPAYWTYGNPAITAIPRLGDSTFGQATAVSSDGTYIAGACNLPSDGTNRHSWIWDSVNGTRDLKAVFTAAGLDMTGWVLGTATDIAPLGWVGVTGISTNGKWISGFGLKDGTLSGYVAFIPEPSSFAVLAFGLLPLLRFRRKS